VWRNCESKLSLNGHQVLRTDGHFVLLYIVHDLNLFRSCYGFDDFKLDPLEKAESLSLRGCRSSENGADRRFLGSRTGRGYIEKAMRAMQ